MLYPKGQNTLIKLVCVWGGGGVIQPGGEEERERQ